MIRQTIEQFANHLVSSQQPLVFIDTCDIINLLQVGTKIKLYELEAVNRLLDEIDLNPN